MSDRSSGSSRLQQVKDILSGGKSVGTIPWDPTATRFPTRSQLPQIEDAPKDAAWVWGANDQLGRLNLLTPSRVAAAAKEIRTGELVPVNLPLNMPSQPAFGRETFKHEIKMLRKNACYDDLYHLNTQSGTQWDGFRHYAHIPTLSFYNGVKGADIEGPNANMKDSIHHWAEHGIAGRGILLDYWGFTQRAGIEYDPFKYHPISYKDLVACGKSQGIDIRPDAQGGDMQVGDILFIRYGWTEQHNLKSPEEQGRLALRKYPELQFAGVAQGEEMKDWLHDCYFAAVAADSPTFEAWPSRAGYQLHEYLLALWGMPIGEMLNLEDLTKKCRRGNRWTFFFSSMPANCPGGVSSHVNGQAIL